MGEHISPAELAEAGYNRWMIDHLTLTTGVASDILAIVLVAGIVLVLLSVVVAGYARNKEKDDALANRNRFAELDGIVRPPKAESVDDAVEDPALRKLQEDLAKADQDHVDRMAVLNRKHGLPEESGVFLTRKKRGTHRGKPS